MKGFLLAGIALVTLSSATRGELPASQVAEARARWSGAVEKLKARDAEEKHPEDSILFIGSSTIRMWENIVQDMAPYHPIQRGYGGAKYGDLVVFAEEMISPHRFRAMVIFAGNDVLGKETDATPEQVAGWFRQIAAVARAREPNADVFCVAVTPTPARWNLWNRIQEVNAALQAACAEDPKLHFVPTSESYLDVNGDGKPKPEFYEDDNLHFNKDGYVVWAGRVKAALRPVSGEK